MSSYIDDRSYTNHIHHNLAIPKIYNKINWKKVDLEQSYAKTIDMQQGIDYIFTDNSGNLKTIQERFRESKYQKYSDFTIRYRRDNNMVSSRRESEYYKMRADYFTYGITNCLKTDISQCTDFIKFAVIDLKKVYEKIDIGLIVIKNTGKHTCEKVNGKIICPIKFNHDGSSSFFPIEIAFLIELWGKDMILIQKGFV